MAGSGIRKQYAGGICFVGIMTIGLIAAGLGTVEWTVAQLRRNDTDCVVTRKLGLFRLMDKPSDTGCVSTTGTDASTYVYDPAVLDFSYGLQFSVIAFCGLSLLFSFVVIGVSAFNICSNPFETYLSPAAMLVYNAIGMAMSLVGVILYTVLFYTELIDPLLEIRPSDSEINHDSAASSVYGANGYSTESSYFGFSFFLVVVSILTYLIGMVLAVMSDRDVVTKCFKPKETVQENKGHDVMMY